MTLSLTDSVLEGWLRNAGSVGPELITSSSCLRPGLWSPQSPQSPRLCSLAHDPVLKPNLHPHFLQFGRMLPLAASACDTNVSSLWLRAVPERAVTKPSSLNPEVGF